MKHVDPQIRLENVGLEFPIHDVSTRPDRAEKGAVATLVGGVARRISRSYVGVSALQDVNVTLEKGARYALLGPNGAGKSTLLRVMAGIYLPTIGRATIRGKVATLFSLGAGADPNLSGYRNIWRLGYLQGMDDKQIEERIDEIIDFVELGEFLYLPNRVYSSGMMTRLAFAISTMSDPDILLIDETFGTGDANFQKKAQERVIKMIESSSILVFASHNAAILKEFCTHGILLSRGKVEMIDEIDTVLDEHSTRQHNAAKK